MDNTKDKMKIVVDLIIEKNDAGAKAELKTIISQHPKMKEYQRQLSEMGFIFEKVDVPEKVYEDLENVLKDYHPAARLKIIDNLYLKISKDNL